MSDRTNEMLNLLVVHEQALAELYWHYAEELQVQGQREFWAGLAREEEGHAQMVRLLQTEMQEGHVRVDVARLSVRTVRDALQYLRSVREVTAEPAGPDAAFAAALDLEDSLVERRMMEAFSSDDPAVQATIARLGDSYGEHFRRIRDARREFKLARELKARK